MESGDEEGGVRGMEERKRCEIDIWKNRRVNSEVSHDAGEALRVYWRFVIMSLKLDLSVWFCVFLQTCSMAWCRKRVGGDLDFIRVVVKKQVP